MSLDDINSIRWAFSDGSQSIKAGVKFRFYRRMLLSYSYVYYNSGYAIFPLYFLSFEVNTIILQEYMAHGSLGLFTQAAFNEQSQDDSSQNHYGGGNARPLQTQVFVYWSLNWFMAVKII